MTDAITGMQIGSVISQSGSVWAISGSSQRPLTEGAPVYKGEEIVTETDSNVEIKFTDNTVLGQGADSAVRLDDYVFTGDDGSLDFHMVKGVLRVVSGEIVKANPESFNLTTPMATIGIRGTEVMVQIDHNREFIGVDKMGEGHTVVISTAFNQVIIDKAGMFSGVDFDGSLIAPDEMPSSFISTIIRAAPLTTLGDPPRSPGDPQDVIPPQVFETIDNQTGEYKPGVGQEPTQSDDGDEDEPIQLTDAEIAALLAMETAAGGDDGVSGEPMGQVVDIGYDAYDPGSGSGSDVGGGTSFGDGQGRDDGDRDTPDDDPPPLETIADDTADPPADPPTDDGGSTDGDPPPPAPTDGADNTTPIEAQTVVQDAEAENTPVTHNVLDGTPQTTLVAAALAQDRNLQGTVTFDAQGTITYVPVPGEAGTVLINYVVEDADGDAAMAQLTITLAPDSQPVIARSNVSGDETDGLVTLNGTLSVDFGADAAGATVALAADGATWDDESGTLTANDGSWAIQTDAAGYTFTQYAPLMHADLSDPDDPYAITIAVTATDGDSSMATGSFTITVDDDGPTADDASFIQDTAPDTAISYNVFTQGDALLGTDAGALTGAALAADSPHEGTVTFLADGTITYTPIEGEFGTVTIDYMVTDGDGDTASAQLSIDLAQEQSEFGEYLPGQGGDTLTGGEGNDTLDGDSGRDVIFGTGGDDLLIGGNSKDAILGGNGNDILDGGRGNDLLIGGMGDDVLTGGKGDDTFVFTSPGDGTDTILDFQSAVDTIVLYNSGFNFDSNNGTLDVNQFAVVEAEFYEGGIDFAGANSGLIYASPTDCSAGTLYFDPNDTVADDEIVLATITESDGSNLVADDIDIV